MYIQLSYDHKGKVVDNPKADVSNVGFPILVQHPCAHRLTIQHLVVRPQVSQ